jgi:hypothetical protein
MTSILWVHDEMLDRRLVVPDQPAIFVFDDTWLADEQVSLKRVVFMYECLLDMPGVEIHRGDVVSEVRAFAARHRASVIETMASPLPRLKSQARELGATFRAAEPFCDLPAEVDLRRFSRYWRKAERSIRSKYR